MQNRTDNQLLAADFEMTPKRVFLSKCLKIATEMSEQANNNLAFDYNYFEEIKKKYFPESPSAFEDQCKEFGYRLEVTNLPSGNIAYALKKEKNAKNQLNFGVGYYLQTEVKLASTSTTTTTTQVTEKTSAKKTGSSQMTRKLPQEANTESEKSAEKPAKKTTENQSTVEDIFKKTKSRAYKSNFEKGLESTLRIMYGEKVKNVDPLKYFHDLCAKNGFIFVVLDIFVQRDKNIENGRRYELFDSHYNPIDGYGVKNGALIPQKYDGDVVIEDLDIDTDGVIALFKVAAAKATKYKDAYLQKRSSQKMEKSSSNEEALDAPRICNAIHLERGIRYATQVRFGRQLTYAEFKTLCIVKDLGIKEYSHTQENEIIYNFNLVEKNDPTKIRASWGIARKNEKLTSYVGQLFASGDSSTQNQENSEISQTTSTTTTTNSNELPQNSVVRSTKKRKVSSPQRDSQLPMDTLDILSRSIETVEKAQRVSNKVEVNIPKIFEELHNRAGTGDDLEVIMPSVTQEMLGEAFNLLEFQALCTLHKYKFIDFDVLFNKSLTKRYELFNEKNDRIAIHGNFPHLPIVPRKHPDDFLADNYPLSKEGVIGLFKTIIQKAETCKDTVYRKRFAEDAKELPNLFIKSIPYGGRIWINREINFSQLNDLCKKVGFSIETRQYKQNGTKFKFCLLDENNIEIPHTSYGPAHRHGTPVPLEHIVLVGDDNIAINSSNTKSKNDSTNDQEAQTSIPSSTKKRKERDAVEGTLPKKLKKKPEDDFLEVDVPEDNATESTVTTTTVTENTATSSTATSSTPTSSTATTSTPTSSTATTSTPTENTVIVVDVDNDATENTSPKNNVPANKAKEIFTELKKEANRRGHKRGDFEKSIPTVTLKILNKEFKKLKTLQAYLLTQQHKLVLFDVMGRDGETERFEFFEKLGNTYKFIDGYGGTAVAELILNENFDNFDENAITTSKEELVEAFKQMVTKADAYQVASYNRKATNANHQHINFFVKAIPYVTQIRFDRQMNFSNFVKLCDKYDLAILANKYTGRGGTKYKFELRDKLNKKIPPLGTFGPESVKGELINDNTIFDAMIMPVIDESDNAPSSQKRKRSESSNKAEKPAKKRKVDSNNEKDSEKQEAEKKKIEAEKNKIEAEKKKIEAEKNKIEAEKKKVETEKMMIVAEKKKEAEKRKVEAEKKKVEAAKKKIETEKKKIAAEKKKQAAEKKKEAEKKKVSKKKKTVAKRKDSTKKSSGTKKAPNSSRNNKKVSAENAGEAMEMIATESNQENSNQSSLRQDTYVDNNQHEAIMPMSDENGSMLSSAPTQDLGTNIVNDDEEMLPPPPTPSFDNRPSNEFVMRVDSQFEPYDQEVPATPRTPDFSIAKDDEEMLPPPPTPGFDNRPSNEFVMRVDSQFERNDQEIPATPHTPGFSIANDDEEMLPPPPTPDFDNRPSNEFVMRVDSQFERNDQEMPATPRTPDFRDDDRLPEDASTKAVEQSSSTQSPTTNTARKVRLTFKTASMRPVIDQQLPSDPEIPDQRVSQQNNRIVQQRVVDNSSSSSQRPSDSIPKNYSAHGAILFHPVNAPATKLSTTLSTVNVNGFSNQDELTAHEERVSAPQQPNKNNS